MITNSSYSNRLLKISVTPPWLYRVPIFNLLLMNNTCLLKKLINITNINTVSNTFNSIHIKNWINKNNHKQLLILTKCLSIETHTHNITLELEHWLKWAVRIDHFPFRLTWNKYLLKNCIYLWSRGSKRRGFALWKVWNLHYHQM